MKRLFSKKISFIQRGDLGDTSYAKGPQISNIIYLYFFIFFICISFLLIGIRLFQLTIVKGDYYKRLSEENRIREIVIEPKRGKILDRKGLVLVDNIEGNINDKTPRIASKRIYYAKEEAAHILGYRQIADANALKNDNCVNKLKLGDTIGKKGIEQLYDCQLRGVSGKKLTEVDAHGNYLRTISVIPPIDGNALQLSLDLDLQKVAYNAIKGKKAVIIGLKPQTGEVLVFVSSPSFNPQKFEDGENSVDQYFLDKEKPMFDRAAEGTYPPGSIFKLYVATGGLEEGKIKPDTIIEDNGFIKAGAAIFHNWYYLQYGRTEGSVDLIKAIRRSNDTYFYKAGEALGAENMKKWASIFGLNQITGIGLSEGESTLPSPFWKSETLGEQWYLGDTYNMAIGQGYTLITPLQLARSILPFANGGKLCKPHLLKNEEPQCSKMKVAEKTLSLIREGMKEACSPGGTGWPLFNFKVKVGQSQSESVKSVKPTDSTNSTDLTDSTKYQSIQTGCKTGTAESQSAKTAPHAWFTVFAPFDNPEIALTVLVEEGGQGSDVGGPIAKEILKAYFERKE